MYIAGTKTPFQCIVVLLLSFGTPTIAQGIPDTLWTRTYGGIGWDRGYGLEQTLDGSYILAGYTTSFGAGGEDVYLIKTDANGDTLWTRTYGGASYDRGFAIRQTNDNGFIIVGMTYSFGSGQGDVYLIKTDSLGNQLWTQTYGGDSVDYGTSVQQTSDNGYVVVGKTMSFGEGEYDIYIVKTNTNGDTLWTKTYGGTHIDHSRAIQQTADAGYIIGGSRDASTNIFLLKTDAQGDSMWSRTYGPGECHDIQIASDNGYVLVGYRYFPPYLNAQFFIIRTDSAGDTLWTRALGSDTSEDHAYSIYPTSDGGYVLSGARKYFGPLNIDAYLIRTDSIGEMIWTKTLGGAGEERAVTVQQTAENGYVVVGWTSSFGAGDDDIYLIKIEPDSLGIEEITTEGPKLLFLDVFPNPFKQTTNFRFQISISGQVQIRIYDAAGRLVKESSTIVDNSPKQITWDGRDIQGKQLPNGVYFLKLTAGNYTATEKLLLIR